MTEAALGKVTAIAPGIVDIACQLCPPGPARGLSFCGSGIGPSIGPAPSRGWRKGSVASQIIVVKIGHMRIPRNAFPELEGSICHVKLENLGEGEPSKLDEDGAEIKDVVSNGPVDHPRVAPVGHNLKLWNGSHGQNSPVGRIKEALLWCLKLD